ncbi:SRPBCC family protein [Dechloromonas sp. XY25]|uniref:SRPBCC family protein n=1 Tax=Dechloromonas hankyongensis TaxID=2908002 RepID=A0ABS9K7F1_9RHOO|nr:SRPBCC family protein [Dechloromonas hankyongensis]MCG2579005.1 SRPBCC family protein [Dechloromonas hankyongensis]
MHTKQAITKKLNVPTDKAWQAIRGIDRLDVWFPIINTCRVDGTGVGAHRHMTLEGGKITDLIEEVSDADQRLVYLRTESPFPVTHYRGTVEVFDSYDAQAVVTWTIDFESSPEDSAAVADLVKNAISDGIDGMEKDLLAH